MNVIEQTIKNAITKAAATGATPEGIAVFLSNLHLHGVYASIPLPGSSWKTYRPDGTLNESGQMELAMHWMFDQLANEVRRIGHD